MGTKAYFGAEPTVFKHVSLVKWSKTFKNEDLSFAPPRPKKPSADFHKRISQLSDLVLHVYDTKGDSAVQEIAGLREQLEALQLHARGKDLTKTEIDLMSTMRATLTQTNPPTPR